ncbi:sensor histidine kinase [Agromyces bauzanensis]
MSSRRVSAGRRLRTLWRRTLFLLIGGLVAIPYALLVGWAVTLVIDPRLTEPAPAALARGGTVLVLVLLAAPAFLDVTRTLERTAANQLLDLDVPEPGHRASLADRLRAALFFAGHLVSGALIVFVIGFAVPLAITFAVDAATGSEEGARLAAVALPWLGNEAAVVFTIVTTVAALLLTVASGILLPWYARTLLGPSTEEQLAAANLAAADLARRNELARELHDTIGHALTLTTVQAAAAARLMDRDPAAARRAIAEVERAGRTAVADLDYALGVLRTPPDERAGASLAMQRPIEALVDEARSAGLDVAYTVQGDPAALPASMRGALYRVAQEALTNALRHAGEPRVAVSLAVGEREVVFEVVNPLAPGRPSRAPAPVGRGLSGIRERAALLGGTSVVGPGSGARDGEWVVEVRLPLGGAS